MKAGTAWRDVTPDHPISLLGQMYERQGKYTRDPLTVSAAVFEDQGKYVAMVTADVAIIPDEMAAELRMLVAQDKDIAGRIDQANVIISATHTHVAPCTTVLAVGEVDTDWVASFKLAIVEAVREAVCNLANVTLWSGNGHIEEMGWNRRGMRRDGTCEMHHGSWREDFAGLEGPRDGHVGVIWATDDQQNVSLVLVSFATHPNCLAGGSFYSADLPGEVRNVLRGTLGQDTAVLYFTGAAGDTSPLCLVDNKENAHPWRGEAGLKRSGLYLGGEILKTIAVTLRPMASQTLGTAHQVLDIPIRLWDAAFDPHKLPEGDMKQFYVNSKNDWDRVMREENPAKVHVHVVRLGDAAICFNPAELFCQFGLAIKADSPAKTTLICELANGWCGYIPTPQAIGHGGYSARSSRVAYCDADTGWQIVERTEALLKELFNK